MSISLEWTQTSGCNLRVIVFTEPSMENGICFGVAVWSIILRSSCEYYALLLEYLSYYTLLINWWWQWWWRWLWWLRRWRWCRFCSVCPAPLHLLRIFSAGQERQQHYFLCGQVARQARRNYCCRDWNSAAWNRRELKIRQCNDAGLVFLEENAMWSWRKNYHRGFVFSNNVVWNQPEPETWQ